MFLVLAISSDSCACFTHRYGEEKLAILIDHFGVVKIDAKLEWIAMRGLLIDAAEKSLTMETFYALIIHPQLESFPILGRMATVAATVPITSVNCERAISTYNVVKTSGRASLKVSSVECLVSLNLEAPSVRDFPYEDAFQAWTLRKQRPGLHVIEKRAAL